jgi:hypothetical protein
VAARKRPSIKGQGASIFLDAREPEPQPTAEKGRIMVTVYLPEHLVNTLDQVRCSRRMQDRKVQKSHIVAEALERYFQTSEC